LRISVGFFFAAAGRDRRRSILKPRSTRVIVPDTCLPLVYFDVGLRSSIITNDPRFFGRTTRCAQCGSAGNSGSGIAGAPFAPDQKHGQHAPPETPPCGCAKRVRYRHQSAGGSLSPDDISVREDLMLTRSRRSTVAFNTASGIAAIDRAAATGCPARSPGRAVIP
jgi:hypothetical protein